MVENEQPTQERWKKVWEWCGLHKEPVTGGLELYCDNEHNIISPVNSTTGLPDPTDLNNLFKYPIAKITEELGYGFSLVYDRIEKIWRCEIDRSDEDLDWIAQQGQDKRLVALWAIYKVMEAEDGKE